MPDRTVLFIDDGGVMNDNRIRGEQWAVLVGQYFSARVGGDPDDWANANRSIFQRVFESVLARMAEFGTHDEFERTYADLWVNAMFAGGGMEPPSSAAERMAYYTDTGRLIPPRVRAAFPGVVDAIQSLADSGLALHTASGESSLELDGYLRGMGVRDCFTSLYGPDLVGIPKAGPEYYRRMFVHALVQPQDALVLDDNAEACSWAEAAGARAMLVDHGRRGMALADVAQALIG